MTWAEYFIFVVGNFHHTTTVAKTLITVVILLQAFMAVQTSLLMRSGDVEKNPGPGKYRTYLI